MKLWLAVAALAIPGLIAWGATQSDVRSHDRRIDAVEADQRARAANDVNLVHRLAGIEAQMRFLVEAESRRQAREDRRQ